MTGEDVKQTGKENPVQQSTSVGQTPAEGNATSPEGGVNTQGQQPEAKDNFVPKPRFDEVLKERNALREKLSKPAEEQFINAVNQPELDLDSADENVKKGLKILKNIVNEELSPIRDELSLFKTATTDPTFQENLPEIKKLVSNPEYAGLSWGILNDIAKGKRLESLASKKAQDILTQNRMTEEEKKKQESLSANVAGGAKQVEALGELKKEDFKPVQLGGKSKEELARIIGRAD